MSLIKRRNSDLFHRNVEYVKQFKKADDMIVNDMLTSLNDDFSSYKIDQRLDKNKRNIENKVTILRRIVLSFSDGF